MAGADVVTMLQIYLLLREMARSRGMELARVDALVAKAQSEGRQVTAEELLADLQATQDAIDALGGPPVATGIDVQSQGE